MCFLKCLMVMDWGMVGRRWLVVLFVFSRAPSWFWRLSLEVLVVFFPCRDVLGRNTSPSLQFGFFDHDSEISIYFVGLELESTMLAACFAAMLGRVWCGLTLVVSCTRFGFQPLHAQLLAVAMLVQLVLVGVFGFSMVVLVVRSLTSLAGYVQSKGESKSSFWQSLMFVSFSQDLSFCFILLAVLPVSGFLRIWIVGERQPGSCTTLFLSAASQRAAETAFVSGFGNWNCFSSSGYGHVLGLRIGGGA